MKHFNTLLLWIACLGLSPGLLQAQGDQPDSKGTDFWIMFNDNPLSNPLDLSLFITSDVATSGTVSGPFTDIPFTTTPGDVTTVAVPITAHVVDNDLVQDLGVRIEAEDEVTVYGLNQKPFTTDAFLSLPTNVLGSEYTILTYVEGSAFSQFGIVATEDNTTVTITPTEVINGRPAGTPYTITLNEGQTYQGQARTFGSDLTGTTISASAPVAVFGAHECANVPVDITFCDHMVEQLPPTSTWGQRFGTAPLATRLAGDIYRVITATDGTEVTITGTGGFSSTFMLNAGEFEELDIPSDEYTTIESTEPILVAQYSKGDESDPSLPNGDPFMLLIPPLEQFLNSYTVSTPSEGFNLNFVNVVAPNSQVGSVTLDGSAIPAGDFTAIGSSGFSAAQVAIDIGSHNLQGTLPFGVFVYGFGNDDSYGYLGGQAFGEVAIVQNISIDLNEAIPNGDEYCFEAEVTDGEGNPLEGVRVDFMVEGANEAEGFAFTDENGIATFCYTPTNAGTDTITATVGDNSDEGTLTIEDRAANTLTLEPEATSVMVGNEVCLMATLVDQFGDPLESAEVMFEVSGDNSASATAITGPDGMAQFCYTPDNAGSDMVTATSGDASDMSTITVTSDMEEPEPTTLTVDPESGTVMVGEEFCFMVELLDQFGDPVAGEDIAVDASGANPGSGTITTDALGMAQFCYTPTNPGEDVVDFTFGDLMATSVVTVTEEMEEPVPTTLTVDPEMGTATVGEEFCFMVELLDQFGDPVEGEMVDVDAMGANPGMGMIVTDADGMAQFCYTPANPGEDVVEFTLGDLTATSEVTVQEPIDLGGARFRVVGPNGEIIDENLEDGDEIDLGDWPRFTIEAIPDEEDVDEIGSIRLELRGPKVVNRNENLAPYFLFGDLPDEGLIYTRLWDKGDYTISATPYSRPKAKGMPGMTMSVDFKVIQPERILQFQVWNNLGDLVISPLEDGDVIMLGEIPGDRFNIEAITVPEFVGSVRMELTGPQEQSRIENYNPYFLYSNPKSTESGLNKAMELIPGEYTITATPFNRKSGKGVAGTPLSVSFTVVAPMPSIVMVDLSDELGNKERQMISSGDVVDLSRLPGQRVFLQAVTSMWGDGSVIFDADDAQIVPVRSSEAGQQSLSEAVELQRGTYSLDLTPFTRPNGQGARGETVTLQVVDDQPSPWHSGQWAEQAADRLRAFPNPASGPFTVELPEVPQGETLYLYLTDLMGRNMDLSHYTQDGSRRIEMNRGSFNLPAGVYFLNAKTENRSFPSIRLVLRD